MFEQRSLKLDVVALALLAVVAFLATALLSYHPWDPPGGLVDPPTSVVENACGRSGAFAAHHALETLGLGAYYATASLAIVTVLLLMRREVDQPMLRAIGWAMSLVGLCTLAAMALPTKSLGPVFGAGGVLGAMAQHWLESRFANAGGYILVLSLTAAGLLLATDYVLLRIFAFTTLFFGRGAARVGRASRFMNRKENDLADDQLDDEDGEYEEDEYADEEYEDDEYEEEDEDDEYEEDEYDDADEDQDDAQVASDIKVRTPASESHSEDVALAPPAQVETTDESQPEQLPDNTPRGLKKRLASALRIRNRQPEEQSERAAVIDQLEAAVNETDANVDYELPPTNLLLPSDDVCYAEHEREVRRKAKVLEKTFRDFGFRVRVVEIETGPVIAQYEVELEAGLRLSRITSLADDLAIALRVPSVRIVAPIPGKNTVGIEVPNEQRQVVRLREVMEEAGSRTKRMKIPIYLGKDVSGSPLLVDLAALPHLLIAGRTGTGKSVCLNSAIVSMLMSRGPDEVRMLMIDPKMVELSPYKKLPHLMHPVVTDMRKAEAILAWAVDKMEERYALLAQAGVRHVSVYNQLSEEELRERMQPDDEEAWSKVPKQLPFIVILADEMADLMMTAGKDVEQHIIRLAQKSRAVGIHLILATQKPTVDVITGLIKSNLPARIAFQVASRTDSRVVLDEMGADKLLGNGDMLFLSPGTSTLLRGQGTFLSDDEITQVVDFVATDAPQFAKELIELKAKEDPTSEPGPLKNRDPLYESAVDVVVREQRGSVSLLQRTLGIGYGRAARLIDFMAEDGIVGEYNGSQAREVLLNLADWEASQGESPTEMPETPRRSNRILYAADDPPPASAATHEPLSSEDWNDGTISAVAAVDDNPAPDEVDEQCENDETEEELSEVADVDGDTDEEEVYEDDDYEDEEQGEDEYEDDEYEQEDEGEELDHDEDDEAELEDDEYEDDEYEEEEEDEDEEYDEADEDELGDDEQDEDDGEEEYEYEYEEEDEEDACEEDDADEDEDAPQPSDEHDEHDEAWPRSPAVARRSRRPKSA